MKLYWDFRHWNHKTFDYIQTRLINVMLLYNKKVIWTSPYHQRMINSHPSRSGAATLMKCDENPQILISFKNSHRTNVPFWWFFWLHISSKYKYRWWWRELIYDERILYSVTRLLCILCAWKIAERKNILSRNFHFISLSKDSWTDFDYSSRTSVLMLVWW